MSKPAAYIDRGGVRENPFLWRPGFTTYYTIGVIYSKRVATFKTLEEVARELEITKQNAYTETVLALGKLLYHTVKAVGEIPEL